jgi:septal ring factor EnvC (AmiA/AmiB activator)
MAKRTALDDMIQSVQHVVKYKSDCSKQLKLLETIIMSLETELHNSEVKRQQQRQVIVDLITSQNQLSEQITQITNLVNINQNHKKF